MNILFCTDGSEISLNALTNISELVKEAIVDVICVIDWSFLPTSMNIESESYSKVYEDVAEGILTTAAKDVSSFNLTLGEQIKTIGSAVEGILEQIDKKEYDLVVMGSHGKKGLQKWLGSVSRQVISNVQIPVFVSKKRTKNKRILFAIDGSEPSYNAIKSACKLIDLSGKEISIISVKENPELLPMEASLDRNWLESIEKQQKIHASKAINKAKMIIDETKFPIQNEAILTGNPAQKIIEFAHAEKIDVIIMGARTKINLSKLLLGSVSKRVLENTDSDVLVINK